MRIIRLRPPCSRRLYRFDHQLQGFFVAVQVGGETAFVADCGREAFTVAQFFKAWKISAPQRNASRKDFAPTGIIINSWMFRLLLACSPPLMTFIIGTGRDIGPAPPSSGKAAGLSLRQRRVQPP